MIKYAKIAVNIINKNNIKSRTFTNNEGQTITVQELELELFDLKEEKVLTVNQEKGKELVKVGFITEKSFKNPEGKWVSGTNLGDITIWRDLPKKEEPKEEISYPEDNYPTPESEGIDINGIPF